MMMTTRTLSSRNLKKQNKKQKLKTELDISLSLHYLIMSQYFRVGYQDFILLF